MRKAIIIMVLFCLCLGICACGRKDKENNGMVEDNSITTKSGTIENRVEDRNITIESYDEYLNFIKSEKLPQSFVEYSQIAEIGEFSCFIYLSNVYEGDYSSYMYDLIDPSGYSVIFTVKDNKEGNTDMDVLGTKDVTLENMRYIEEGKRGIFVSEGVSYRYASGKLLDISWSNSENTYYLGGDYMLCDYPDNDATIIGQLLNLTKSDINSIIPLIGRTTAVFD